MAGSPAYINLLAEIGIGEPLPDIHWGSLAKAWDDVEGDPQPMYLMGLANVAFNLLAQESAKALPAVMAEAVELHVAKNAGYAGADNPDPWANFRLSSAFGVHPVQGVLVRMTDKYSRIQALRRNPANDRIGESILDTLRDLAAYALIAICILDEERAAA